MSRGLLWKGYDAAGAVYEALWRKHWIKPGGNEWHAQRAGHHARREDRPLWLHAASLGEVRVAQAYREGLSECAPLYLTIQTDAGFRAAVAAFGSAHVSYAPLDRPECIKRFLTAVNPRGLVVFETEIWPNWLWYMQGPVWFANARLSSRSFSRLLWLQKPLAPIWSHVRMVFAQTSLDAQRFTRLGLPESRTQVVGQVKQFELLGQVDLELRTRWRKRLGLTDRDLLYVAGSVRHDELATVVAQFRQCTSLDRTLHLALAPRHLKHVGEAERVAWEKGFRTRRISSVQGESDGAEVFLLDTHGDLATFYAAADLVWLGGTFGPHGGHNPNEPAAFGVPVVTGPHTEKIDADLALLSEVDLSYRLENFDDLPRVSEGLHKFNRALARHGLEDLLRGRPHPARLLVESVKREWSDA